MIPRAKQQGGGDPIDRSALDYLKQSTKQPAWNKLFTPEHLVSIGSVLLILTF